MTSSPESIITSLLQNDYAGLVIVTAVGYDYVLTFSTEVEYIWKKPWTSVSTLFVLIRYIGICGFILLALVGCSFIPGPGKFGSCAMIETTSSWMFFIFICAADLVMLLRVWAMYNRSKLILYILLTTYVAEIIPSIVNSIVYSIPRNDPTITVVQISDFRFCTSGPASLAWNKATGITQLIHVALMCTLVIIEFVRQLLGTYRTAKQWRLNRFMKLLAVEGVVYFLVILAWNLVNVLAAFQDFSVTGSQIVPVNVLQTVPAATLTPRFVLSVRQLYARNVQAGSKSAIDSGFGLASLTDRFASRSVIMFANGEQNEELELGEGTPVKEEMA